MRRIGALVVALGKNWFRSRESVFFTLVFPLVLFVIFSAVFAGGGAEFTLHVQNNDVGPDGEPTTLSAALVDGLESAEPLTVKRVEPGRNLTEWSREAGATETRRVLVIPDGFDAQVRNSSARARMAVIRDTLNRTGGGGTVNGSAVPGGAGVQGDADPATVRFLASPDDDAAPATRSVVETVLARFNEQALGVDEPPARLESGDLGTRSLGATAYFLPAIIGAVLVLNGIVNTTTVVAEFRANGTLKRLASTPLRKREWIAANLVHQALLALVTVAVLVLTARLLFGVTAIPGPVSIALILLGAAAFAGIGMVLGSFLTSQDAATSLGNAIALPLLFVSGVFWEIDLMPELFQTIARLSPLWHFHRGLRRAMILGRTDGLLVPFALMGTGAVLSLAVAVRVADWREFDE